MSKGLAMRRSLSWFLLAGYSLLSFAGELPATAQVYKDPSRPISERVNDLIRRMTLEEKVRQMQNDAPAIPRLGIPHFPLMPRASVPLSLQVAESTTFLCNQGAPR
jgi:hypothetical protein